MMHKRKIIVDIIASLSLKVNIKSALLSFCSLFPQCHFKILGPFTSSCEYRTMRLKSSRLLQYNVKTVFYVKNVYIYYRLPLCHKLTDVLLKYTKSSQKLKVVFQSNRISMTYV